MPHVCARCLPWHASQFGSFHGPCATFCFLGFVAKEFVTLTIFVLKPVHHTVLLK